MPGRLKLKACQQPSLSALWHSFMVPGLAVTGINHQPGSALAARRCSNMESRSAPLRSIAAARLYRMKPMHRLYGYAGRKSDHARLLNYEIATLSELSI